MKITHFLTLTIFLFNTACNSDDNNDPINPINELPPATQIGAQTFGCLINGEVFLPKMFGQNRLSSYVQEIDGLLNMSILSTSDNRLSLFIQAFNVPEIKQKTYSLVSEMDGSFFGKYQAVLSPEEFFIVRTTDVKPGKLNITKYDPENFIISGTFEFTVLDNNGKEIMITDGRFDLKYTN